MALGMNYFRVTSEAFMTVKYLIHHVHALSWGYAIRMLSGAYCGDAGMSSEACCGDVE
jgi:hypothetical protein